MPDLFSDVLILAVFGLLLWLAVIPMAARRASVTSWWLHTALAVIAAVAQTVVVTRIYSTFTTVVPWWTVSAHYVALVTGPMLVSGLVARAAVRRWPGRRWLAPSLVVMPLLLILVAAVVTQHAGPFVLPEMINAVQ